MNNDSGITVAQPLVKIDEGLQRIYKKSELLDPQFVINAMLEKATEAKLLALDQIIKIIPNCTRVGELASATKILDELSQSHMDLMTDSKKSLLKLLNDNMINADDTDFEMISDIAPPELQPDAEMASNDRTFILNAMRNAITSRARVLKNEDYKLPGLLMTDEPNTETNE